MTTTTSTDQHRAELRTRALNALDSLDGNGVDFLVLGVAAHLALRLVAGEEVTAEQLGEELAAEQLGEELDGYAVDAANELLDTAYFTCTDGGFLRLTEFDDNGVEIEPGEMSR